MRFYKLIRDSYVLIPESASIAKLNPAMLTTALEQSKTEGQTAALRAFRPLLRPSK